MATGALDANGIWLYGEDDSEPTASALLNKLGNSVSDKFDGGLPVANGGTGATTAAAARTSLRIGWHQIGDALVDNLVAAPQLLTTTYTYVTGTSFTVTTTGKDARITLKAIYMNGTSGAARWVSHRLIQDGVQLGNAVVQIPVTYITTNDHVYSEYTYKWTPAAGSHTYKLQALAQANSTTYIRYAYITLEEYEA